MEKSDRPHPLGDGGTRGWRLPGPQTGPHDQRSKTIFTMAGGVFFINNIHAKTSFLKWNNPLLLYTLFYFFASWADYLFRLQFPGCRSHPLSLFLPHSHFLSLGWKSPRTNKSPGVGLFQTYAFLQTLYNEWHFRFGRRSRFVTKHVSSIGIIDFCIRWYVKTGVPISL